MARFAKYVAAEGLMTQHFACSWHCCLTPIFVCTGITGSNYRNCRILTYAIAPLCSHREIRLRALALLLQTSGARAHSNSSREAT